MVLTYYLFINFIKKKSKIVCFALLDFYINSTEIFPMCCQEQRVCTVCVFNNINVLAEPLVNLERYVRT